ncbi:hypothetical protein SLS61_004219 [Didymella pomorum]
MLQVNNALDLNMSYLMDLPRELRDQICNLVLIAESERPDITASFDKLIEGREHYTKPKLDAICKVVLYLSGAVPQNNLTLLTVNRQLHLETRENLKAIARRPSYSLDIIVLDEILLLPTWLSIPVMTTNLDTMNVTFRISGSYNARKEFDLEMNRDGPYARWGRYKGFQGGDGGPPAMSWQVYAVLERFIKVGPAGEIEGRSVNKHFTVKCMKIDFQTPPGIPQERLGPPLSGSSSFGGRKDTRGRVLDPIYLADYVAHDLGCMLWFSKDTWFSCGQILYEHLDELVLHKDGKEFQRWDIAEQLRNLEDSSSVRKYRPLAWQKRRERGLKCLD